MTPETTAIKSVPINNGEHKFDQGSVLSVLLKTAFPIVVLMVANAAYGFFDSLLSSNLVEYGYLGGVVLNGGTSVGLIIPLMQFVVAFEVMIAVGAGLAYTQSMAQGNKEEARLRHEQATTMIVFIGLVVWLFIAVFGLPYILTVSGNWTGNHWGEYTKQMVLDGYAYMFILGAAFIPMQLQQSYIRVLRAEGKGTAAGFIPIIGIVLNLCLDYLFMGVLGTGIWGAGLATLIATTSGLFFITLFVVLAGKSSELVIKLRLPSMKIHKEVCIVILAFAMGSLLRRVFDSGTVITLSAFIGNMNVENAPGDLAHVPNWTGTWTIVTRSLNVGSMIALGVAQTMSMLVSYYSNSNQDNKVRETMSKGITMMFIATLIAIGVVFLLQKPLFYGYAPNTMFGWEFGNPISIAFMIALIYSIPLSMQPLAVMYYAGLKKPKLTLIHTITFNAIVVASATIGLIINLFTGHPLYIFTFIAIGGWIGFVVTMFIFNHNYKQLSKN